MPTHPSKEPKSGRAAQASGSVYHGVRLQAMNGHSRFSTAQIKRAVEAAIVKNADVFSRK